MSILLADTSRRGSRKLEREHSSIESADDSPRFRYSRSAADRDLIESSGE